MKPNFFNHFFELPKYIIFTKTHKKKTMQRVKNAKFYCKIKEN